MIEWPDRLLSQQEKKGIPIEFADSRLELGKVYGIYADAAAVAITG